MQYEDSMIAKLFGFQFVNSYASFFYLAFAARFRGECDAHSCMYHLSYNLAVIYGSLLASEIAPPIIASIMKCLKRCFACLDRCCSSKLIPRDSIPEEEYALKEVRLRHVAMLPAG